MRLKNKESQVQIMLVQDEIITYEVSEDIQQRIRPPAGGIPESLQRHEPAERRIEKINERYDPFFCHLFNTVKTAKILINRDSPGVKMELTFTDNPAWPGYACFIRS
jgi:hypothetical protein